MKILKYIFIFLFIVACDNENANDCFQKTGDIIQQEISVEAFSKIFVNRDIELIITEGATQKVVIETGDNLMNDVTVEVVDSQLILTDNNTCNYFRDYGVTKVYVISPNITEIRSSTQYTISSNGVLTYPSLTILSEDYGAPDTITNGEFNLNVNNNSLIIVFNNLSNCYVSGSTTNLNITFAASNSRFEGAHLLAENVTISHRSSNDMIVNPQQSIQGVIRSTGDVISKNQPPVIQVEELYTGRLLFE
ncbi:hypothetical protein BWZ22_09485 [Seonamhaeicola sp. S2-3]|uniref:head GIN domain-containing protein n=1 Tax=Seonamhaeicola sp. S2-3 TaxID=1936081 RepID=UPI000972A570|nr:head GIN domain-containing protein [Seonamhaeicola sp. S2-3]APY11466.1 hypothetical protein BWZ22_09485 [Seonamhaeicola sp. S2-3]